MPLTLELVDGENNYRYKIFAYKAPKVFYATTKDNKQKVAWRKTNRRTIDGAFIYVREGRR